MKKYLSALSVCGLLLAAMLPLAASAATTGASFNVTAMVAATCSVNATNVAFGSIGPASTTAGTATGTVVATCTNGTPYTIDLSTGSGSFAQRTMSDGTSTLNYNLYSDATYSGVLGDGTESTVLISASTPDTGTAGTGTGTAQTYTVFGQLPLPQTAATAGAYTDSIVVTLNY